MTIGERIKARREDLNMTLEDLGKRCGTTKQTIYKYENSIVTNIPIPRLEKIAEALGVSTSYLMGWEPPKTSLSERIAQLMARRNMTYNDMEMATGIPRSTIHRYVTRGNDRIPIQKLEQIADALHVPTNVLLGWTQDENGNMVVDYSAVEKAPSEDEALTDEEKQILIKLREMPAAQREALLKFIGFE